MTWAPAAPGPVACERSISARYGTWEIGAYVYGSAPAPVSYTLTTSATNGTITRTPNQSSYTSGTTVTLQATPNSGYVFTGWSGDLTGTTNPATIVMNSNKSVTANFAPVPITIYTLTVSATNGTVTKTPNQTSYASGTTVTLQATPNSGYIFTGWSGDSDGHGQSGDARDELEQVRHRQLRRFHAEALRRRR